MEYFIYTDGSTKNNGGENAAGGYAFMILDNNEKILYSYSKQEIGVTNQQMELTAAIKGLTWFTNNLMLNDPNFKVTLFSDSAYLINCYRNKWYKNWLKNGWINSKKQPVANKDLWMRLLIFFENNDRFNFEKVAGHADNKYNNMVDMLAQTAAQGE